MTRLQELETIAFDLADAVILELTAAELVKNIAALERRGISVHNISPAIAEARALADRIRVAEARR